MTNKETIIQSLKRIEDVIYAEPYDNLTDYLMGVRDMINLINGDEPCDSIADHILKSLNEIKDLKYAR